MVLGQPNGKTAIPDNGGTDDDSLNRPFSAISTGSMVAIFDDTNSRVMIHDTFPVIDQEAADVVIFQPNLFSDDPNHIIANARSFNSPTSTRMAGGILFMTDDLHHRVLGWSTEPQVHNKAADIVLGQSNFDGSSAGDGANRMSRPRSLAHDPVGDRLFVCDKNNHRVLVFDGPFTVGMSASEWIGQTLDIDDTPGLSDTRMNGPEGLSYDGTNLWVVDKENHRVLRFPPAGQVRDGVADIVLGQPDFFSNTQNHGDADGTRGLDEPTGIVATGAEVIVGDRDNHRVMIWSPQPTLNNDPAAAIVLGQPDFTIPGVEGVSRTAMSFPSGVESDGTVLLIVDSNNHRTLIWDAMPTLNNEPADRIIGQPDFDTLLPNQGGVSEFSLYIGQRGLTKVAKPSLTGTTLWMPDQRNHRLLRYDIAP